MAIKLYVYESSTVTWYYHYKRHNNYGPAVTWLTGYKEWWVNGEIHRLYGPAVEYSDGYKEWWVNGVEYSYLEYLVAAEQYTCNN